MRSDCNSVFFGRGRARRRAARGFTLIESATATIIIGISFTALLELLGTGTVCNNEATELTSALNLAGNIHEAAVRVPYDDVFDLEGTYSPPVDARLQSMAAMTGWSQVVDVSYVDEKMLTSAVPDTQYEPTARVTVSVLRNGKQVYQTRWIAAASE
jgi:prepilin-type N-terminal cleavage/methylation domain-containing protein